MSLVFETSETQHWKTLFPNKNRLLGSHNLNEGEELIAEIDGVSLQNILNKNGKEEEVAIIKFTNVAPMVMNVTNALTISSLYGDLYTGWTGKKIQIYAVPVKAFGIVQTALRVRGAIPNTNEDISVHQADLSACETTEELRDVFTAIPKHLKPQLATLKDSMKEKLSENS